MTAKAGSSRAATQKSLACDKRLLSRSSKTQGAIVAISVPRVRSTRDGNPPNGDCQGQVRAATSCPIQTDCAVLIGSHSRCRVLPARSPTQILSAF